MKQLVLSVFFVILSAIIFADDFIIDEPGSSSSSAPAQPVYQTPSVGGPAIKTATWATGNGQANFIGSVPTPLSVTKGALYSDFVLYDGGGMTARVALGAFDIIGIGVTENFDGLIGSGNVNVNIPGAYIRLTLIRDMNNFNWSLGFDSFAYGKNGTFYGTNGQGSTVYGFYSAFGWRTSILGGSDINTFGFRIPLLPADFRDIGNTSLFGGTTVSLSKYFVMGFTLENLYISFNRPEEILPSMIAAFYPIPQFKISLCLQYEFNQKTVNRVLSLGYEAGF